MRNSTQELDAVSLGNTLVNPAAWADEDAMHAVLTTQRRSAPLCFVKPHNFEAFWSVTRYDHIKAIGEDKRRFVNDPRPMLMARDATQAIRLATGRRHMIRSLVQMDDPDHRLYRQVTQRWFHRSNLEALQTQISTLAEASVAHLVSLGSSCDFVKDIALQFPLRVIMAMLGLPAAHEPHMLKLTQELFGSADPDLRRSFAEEENYFDVLREFESYFAALTEERRSRPTGDVASVIANARIGGALLPETESNGYYILLATAGHETTSSTLSGALLALIRHSRVWEQLRADPDNRIPAVVEEAIRWVSPVRHFMRTATQEVELGGQQIRAGESLALWYPSANRDETVFEAPFQFRLDRMQRHLGFGHGGHACLGQTLARMELHAFLKALINRVAKIELAGEPRYQHSNFVGGLKSLPISVVAQ